MVPYALTGLTFVERFYSYNIITSTNDIAKGLQHYPKKGIYCIQADRQTAGRGRPGHSFFSDNNGGLWVTLVTKVEDISSHFTYNRAISLAIVRCLEQYGKSQCISIKWPNDIFWNKKKICGILLENHPKFSNILLIGFGINVNINYEDFPPELRPIATSLKIETDTTYSLVQILRTILKNYIGFLSLSPEKAHRYYMKKLYGIGKKIKIENCYGILEGVELDGKLKVTADGNTHFFSTGSPHFFDE